MRRITITRQSPAREELEELFLKEKDVRARERYHAMFLMHVHQNAADVAAIMGRDNKTILTWIKAFNASGIDGLKRGLPSGRPSRLNTEQKATLKWDVKKGPRSFGYDFSNWDAKRVAYHIQKKFGVNLGVRRVQILLHELDFTVQRPKRKYAKANAEAQEQFKQDLKKKWTRAVQTTSSFF